MNKFRIKHKEFNLYINKLNRLKRGVIVPKGQYYETDSVKDITKFYRDSNKGELKGKLIIEIISE